VAITFLAKADGRTTVSVARAGLRDADQQPVASSGTPAFVEIKPAAAIATAAGKVTTKGN
jgi:hypothetical protein